MLDREFPDADIACHARLTRARGIALCGPRAADIVPEVPEADFIRSLVQDIDEYDFRAYGQAQFASNILILGRVLSYLEMGEILDKYEGGVWAEGALPEALRPAVRYALDARYGSAPANPPDEALLEAYRAHVIGRIHARLKARGLE